VGHQRAEAVAIFCRPTLWDWEVESKGTIAQRGGGIEPASTDVVNPPGFVTKNPTQAAKSGPLKWGT